MTNGKAKAIPSPEEEPSELAKFRAEWRAELESRKRVRQAHLQATSVEAAPSASTGSSAKLTEKPYVFPVLRSKEPTTSSSFNGLHPAITPEGKVLEQKRTKALTSALDAYQQAVQHEQAGNLDEALYLYRQAFRMDAHVDRAYRREEMLSNIANQQAGRKHPPPCTASTTHTTTATTTMTQPQVATEEANTVTAEAPSIKPQALQIGQAVVTGTLGALVALFLEQEPTLAFRPEDETQPVAFDNLPEEILVEIIQLLDYTSIERFAIVCKKARVLTLESSIWRSLVISTYKEPQIPDLETLAEVITRYMFDYRRVFIEQPRVRTDGVYIAICHYIRPGSSENHWVNISHLITYHRYLRFYPNGQVLSLLANEEHPPQKIINMLKPSLRMKGLYIGTWALAGTNIILSNLFDASGRFIIPAGTFDSLEAACLTTHPHHSHPHPHSHSHSHSHSYPHTEQQPSRYVFAMSLALRSRPLGRWNRLDIQSYDTLNIETGDVTPVALKHERPFWFSKVRSYA